MDNKIPKFRPAIGQSYFIYIRYGILEHIEDAVETVYNDTMYDYVHFKAGNCFKNKAQALKYGPILYDQLKFNYLENKEKSSHKKKGALTMKGPKKKSKGCK